MVEYPLQVCAGRMCLYELREATCIVRIMSRLWHEGYKMTKLVQHQMKHPAPNAGRTNKGRTQLKDDAGAVTDKAYEREYLAHDRKRIRRD